MPMEVVQKIHLCILKIPERGFYNEPCLILQLLFYVKIIISSSDYFTYCHLQNVQFSIGELPWEFPPEIGKVDKNENKFLDVKIIFYKKKLFYNQTIQLLSGVKKIGSPNVFLSFFLYIYIW